MAGYTFNKRDAQRISKSVQATERLNVTDQYYPYRGRGAAMSLGKYEGDGPWAKDSEATVEVYDMKTREKTERIAKVYNLFAEIPSGAWVLFQQGYLLAGECEVE